MEGIKKKSKFRVSYLVFTLVILSLIGGGIFFARAYLSNSGYHNESSFKKYASDYMDNLGSKQVGTAKVEIKYGDPVSTAIEKPTLDNSVSTDLIHKEIETSRKTFEANYGSSNNSKTAFLLGYEAYKTPEKVNGLAIHQTIRLEDDKGNIKTISKVKAFNFATKSGLPLSSIQIFDGDFFGIYEKEAKVQLEKKLGKDIFTEIANPISNNRENFIMTDKGFKFFFDSGTVATDDKGVISIEIPYEKFSKIMRGDIGNRTIDPSKPMIAMTYDDGPSATTTPQLLDLYQSHDCVCSFFEIGQNVDNIKSSPDLLKRMLSMGCEIGSHSYSHPNLPSLSAEEIKEQANKTDLAIKGACGKSPTIFRPPYGNGSEEIAKIFNLPSINWTVDTMDWSSRNADKIIAIIKNHPNLDGQIVLMHSIHQPSVDASRVLVPWLQEQGYQLVTLTELFHYKYGETLQKGKNYGYKLPPAKI